LDVPEKGLQDRTRPVAFAVILRQKSNGIAQSNSNLIGGTESYSACQMTFLVKLDSNKNAANAGNVEQHY